MIKYVFEESLCTACGACAIACMAQNDIDAAGGQKPFRKVMASETEDGSRCRCFSSACMHCDEPACMYACPADCFRKDEESGLVIYDNSDCTGCHDCEAACPYDAISFRTDPSGSEKMEKCDGCYVRILYGLDPACVRNCPTGALRVVKA